MEANFDRGGDEGGGGSREGGCATAASLALLALGESLDVLSDGARAAALESDSALVVAQSIKQSL